MGTSHKENDRLVWESNRDKLVKPRTHLFIIDNSTSFIGDKLSVVRDKNKNVYPVNTYFLVKCIATICTITKVINIKIKNK